MEPVAVRRSRLPLESRGRGTRFRRLRVGGSTLLDLLALERTSGFDPVYILARTNREITLTVDTGTRTASVQLHPGCNHLEIE